MNRSFPIEKNPLRTKQDMQLAFRQLAEPLLPYYSPSGARLRLSDSSGVAYGTNVAELEGFSRMLWGLGPLLGGGGRYPELEEAVRKGLRSGPDPDHPDYWGKAVDYDQRLVEMAAFGLMLALAADQVWEPLDDLERTRLAAWLEQINRLACWDCNWLFFAVIVNLGLKAVGAPYDQAVMERNLERIDAFYLDDGWYADGEGGHCDYYGPFALHFYGLIYAKLMGEEDPVRSARYKARAEAFAHSFAYWFAGDGSALPYGRSLTYRFAQSAFWGAAVYAGIEPFSMGAMKGILLRNLRWWFRQPIFLPDGTLSIGYTYANLVMAENYNSPQSPYWAMKSFLPLVLPEEHPFWQAEEEEMPALHPICHQKAPHLTIVRQEETYHLLAFNSGHGASNEHTHTFAKYEKFVYSNVFGFSVPRASWGLAQGAFDSMLALSEGGEQLYRVKRVSVEQHTGEGYLYMKWLPWRDVVVRTWIVPGAPWHVRIHAIESARLLDAAEGGFSLGLDMDDAPGESIRMLEGEREGMAHLPWGASGIRSLHGFDGYTAVFPNTNTNLIHRRTVLPTLTKRIEPGSRVWLASAVFGDPQGDGAHERWHQPPRVQLTESGSGITVMGMTKDDFTLPIFG